MNEWKKYKNKEILMARETKKGYECIVDQNNKAVVLKFGKADFEKHYKQIK